MNNIFTLKVIHFSFNRYRKPSFSKNEVIEDRPFNYRSNDPKDSLHRNTPQ